ncbi:TPR repeat containing exported protein [Vulgatibacter incomptus]|uniref:TPR repeat containing exported protein n=1 Tax=Vulgatibacter incomptus TaxID=1391653 RepID=A0A0K1PBY8_9BACT|nr:TPR repeat containing exported protein [Vulgatibacter incomptus]
MRDELGRMRAEREQDRRKVRALEAQVASLARRLEAPETARPEPGRDQAVSLPTGLHVVRLEPTTAPEDDEDSYAYIVDGGSPGRKAQRPSARTGGPDAAPPLPLSIELADPPEIPGAKTASGGDFDEGIAALRAGQPARAIELLERFVGGAPLDSRSDDAVLAVGDAWLLLGKPGNALKAFERVATDYPAGNAVPDALLRYGETCLSLGRDVAARAAFKRLVEDHPESPAAIRAKVLLAAR